MINWPDNPVDNQRHTEEGVTWEYSADTNSWHVLTGSDTVGSAIISDPAVGLSQEIQVSAATDTPLTLRGAVDQTARLLTIRDDVGDDMGGVEIIDGMAHLSGFVIDSGEF